MWALLFLGPWHTPVNGKKMSEQWREEDGATRHTLVQTHSIKHTLCFIFLKNYIWTWFLISQTCLLWLSKHPIARTHIHTQIVFLGEVFRTGRSEISHKLAGFLSQEWDIFSPYSPRKESKPPWPPTFDYGGIFPDFFSSQLSLSIKTHHHSVLLLASTEKRQDNGRVYFVNHNTRTTQWDDPRTQGWDCEPERVLKNVHECAWVCLHVSCLGCYMCSLMC